MKIGIFTGGTSVRLKNIFTDFSQFPTGKHEINIWNLNGPLGLFGFLWYNNSFTYVTKFNTVVTVLYIEAKASNLYKTIPTFSVEKDLKT